MEHMLRNFYLSFLVRAKIKEINALSGPGALKQIQE